MGELIRVYLAGRIGGAAPWRNELVAFGKSDLPESRWSGSFTLCTDARDDSGSWWEVLGQRQPQDPGSVAPDWPIIPGGFLGLADYVGPYAIAWNEVDNIKPHNSYLDTPNNLTAFVPAASEHAAQTDRRREVVSRCMAAIDKADVVVAVITGPSPGTLCELGYACAKKRPILAIIRDGSDFDWFPRTLCTKVWTQRDDEGFFSGLRHILAHLDITDNGPSCSPPEHPYHGLYRALADAVEISAYYRSRWWARRREAALERAGRKCQLCAATASLQVHHNSYANIYREPDTDLVVLCDPCHVTADVRRRAQEKAK